MKKKGFTLIELLAVIIILAIVALIATPIVLDIIEDVRRSAFEQSALGYYKATEYIYNEMFLDGDTQDINFTFKDGIQTSSNPDYKLEVSGEKPKGGMIYLNEDGQILVSIHNGKFCATTNGMGQVSISENVDNCGYSPEECFTYSDFTISTTIKNNMKKENQEFEGMDGQLLQIDSFDSTNPACKGIVIIPDEHEGRKVEGIKANVFKENIAITAVVLPKELKVINNYVFQKASNLKQVVMNDELRSIGNFAFNTTNLSEVTIPEKVVYLGGQVFSNTKVKKVNILNSMANISTTNAANMFTNATDANADKGFGIKEVYIGSNVQNIPNGLFQYQKISEVIIPNSVTSIGNSAFKNNQLASIIIPNSVTSIGQYAFSHNQLTSVTIDGGINSIGGSAFRNNQIMSIVIPDSVTSVGALAFENNQITSISIPISVTSIYGGAFNNNQLPDNQAFIYARNADGTENKTKVVSYGGLKREKVIIPSGVANIGGYAFAWNQLTSIVIPDSLVSIGEMAFQYNQLTSVTFPNGMVDIGKQSFYNNQLTGIIIPSSVTTIGMTAFASNNFPNANAITIEGDSTRFDETWTTIGFPAK